MNTQKDIIKNAIYNVSNEKPKKVKMNDIFQTKNNQVIYKEKNSIKQILNNVKRIQMDKLIKRHRNKM